MNLHGYQIAVWTLECVCGNKFEKRGLVLNPKCPVCGKPAKVVKREPEKKP